MSRCISANTTANTAKCNFLWPDDDEVVPFAQTFIAASNYRDRHTFPSWVAKRYFEGFTFRKASRSAIISAIFPQFYRAFSVCGIQLFGSTFKVILAYRNLRSAKFYIDFSHVNLIPKPARAISSSTQILISIAYLISLRILRFNRSSVHLRFKWLRFGDQFGWSGGGGGYNTGTPFAMTIEIIDPPI